MYGKILCPVDGSDPSNAGMFEAIELAAEQQAELLFIHVIDSGPLAMYLPMTAAVFECIRQAGQEILDGAIAAAGERGVKAEARLLTTSNNRVSSTIADEAARYQPDLIVMGTLGRHGMGRALLGGDAVTVAGTTTAPVLMVKSRDSGASARTRPI